MIDPIMSFWDIAALVPIVKGAGGIITDYHGNDPLKGNSIVAASPQIHSQIIKELSTCTLNSTEINETSAFQFNETI
jgi:myo-inositol-1(or 4)-monophosphatase